MSKIKIGIFGDSYANAEHGHEDYPNMQYDAWFYKLDNIYEATSYGVSGSSNYYSYQEFLKHNHKYDKNVFLITYPGRHPSSEIYLEKNTKFDFLGKGAGVDFEKGKRLFPSSATTANYLIVNASQYNIDTETLQKLHAIRDYYVFLENRDFDLTVTKLFINNIKQIRPDTIFVNLFYERFYTEPTNLWGMPLVPEVTGPTFLEYNDAMARGIVSTSNNKYKFPHQITSNYFEKRCVCHFSVETNLVVASHMSTALSTGHWNPVVSTEITHAVKGLEYYYHVRNPITNTLSGF